ncbi:MAG: signal peptidase II, partial [Candidatus Humimicrobiaceae bacterium]
GFVLGGAIGNLYDRYFIREVTDFIYLRFFAVFNGADSFIVVGFIILLIFLIKNFFGKTSIAEAMEKNAK